MHDENSKKYVSKREIEYTSAHTTTTFQMSRYLHTRLKMMCLLTRKSMGEFIRLAIIDKINAVEMEKIDEHD